MRARSLVRMAFTVLAAPFVVVLYLNIETYAQSEGWDTILKGTMEGRMPGVVSWALQPWVGLTGLALICFTLGLWTDAILRHRKRKSSFFVGPKVFSPAADNAKRAILKDLDDLFVEGVRHKNRLIPPVGNYNDAQERAILADWQALILARLDEAGVSIAVMSRFRTFNEFNPTFRLMSDKSDEQNLLEAIWNEKLRQLRAIIDALG